MFPGQPAIGRRIRSWRDENVLREIVGAVDDVKYSGLADRERALVYVPHNQAGVALGLSALGVYGVTSYAFTLRRREMGIRLALGATGAHLYALVMKHGLALDGAGLAFGLAGAFAATRFLRSLLFETSTTDAAAWTTMIAVVLVSTCVASVWPARRAAAADPTRALRAD